MTAQRQIQGLRSIPVLIAVMTVSLIAGQSLAQETRAIRIGVIPGALRFDTTKFEATTGESLSITFNNNGLMQHNWLLVAPGKADAVVNAAMALGSDGMAANWVPDSKDVLQSTRLVDPGKAAELSFKAPETPGEYPYVCTFPGHGIIMRGIMTVKPAGTTLESPVTESVTNISIRNNFEGVTYTNKPEGSPAKPYLIRTYMPDPGLDDGVFPNHGKGLVARRYSPDKGDDVDGTVPPIDGIPAAIGLSFGKDLSLCFDTTECRLLYAWKNGFLDMTAYWGGGPGGGRKSFDYVPRLTGEVFFKAEPGHPARINGQTPGLRFRSINYRNQIPSLTYLCNASEISETYSVGENNTFALNININAAEGENVVYTISDGLLKHVTQVDGRPAGNFDGRIRVAPATSASHTLLIRIP